MSQTKEISTEARSGVEKVIQPNRDQYVFITNHDSILTSVARFQISDHQSAIVSSILILLSHPRPHECIISISIHPRQLPCRMSSLVERRL